MRFWAIIVLLASVVWSCPVAHRNCRADGPKLGIRLVASGVLRQQSDREANTRFVLSDDQGRVRYLVATDEKMDLQSLIGRKVELVGRVERLPDSDRRKLHAESITPQLSTVQFTASDDAEPELTPQPQSSDASVGDIADSSMGLLLAPPDNTPELLLPDQSPVLLDRPLDEPAPMPLEAPGPTYTDSAIGAPHRIWFRSDALFFRTKVMGIPALVTSSPDGTPREDAGRLGVPGTQVRFGDTNLFNDGRIGTRLVLGAWLGSRRRVGLEGEYLGLDHALWDYFDQSNGLDIIARPYYNVDPNLLTPPGQDAELISYPNVTAGSIQVETASRFRSAGLHLVTNLAHRNGCSYASSEDCPDNTSGYRLDLMGGYRYLRLSENVDVNTLTSVSVIPQAGFDVSDSFRARNNFHGGELGLRGEYYRGRWSMDSQLKLALGRTEQALDISGSTALSTVGIVTDFEGGLLALSTNIGDYNRKKTDLIIELGISAAYLVTPRLRATLGYTLIYWPHVIRAGDQINTTVNGSYIPDPTITPSGPLQPSLTYTETDYWAQGITIGFDYRW